ncbi:hypothetical protein SSABA_v1c01800 [Spiroplasma sabaudiense Ar-1343]|uniref:protein-tyrosine-phosphatase n=1 Tax=Spiroplasma sabaudiense Ar-1343 TaxID=1276257 RepID=W6A993_9MOLU|nr:dual specificity protein phosphatase [Spiroplasma sabaudiense]AHI53592.1 hypothetical protein SSABA_v1c01800 [Spiroplasma sabaudiense Ar-1343]
MKKIVDNLYLGDRHSAPETSKLIISCAEEIFNEQNSGETSHFQKDEIHHYFNFEDYPKEEGISKSTLSEVISLMERNIPNQEVYVHCIWGVNRSASIVFMYLVKNKKIPATSFKAAQKAFQKIYPKFSPNPGWQLFLINNFPYNNLV